MRKGIDFQAQTNKAMAKVERSRFRSVGPSIVHRLPTLVFFLLTFLASLQGHTLPKEAEQYVTESEDIWKGIEGGDEAFRDGQGYNPNLARSTDEQMMKQWAMGDQTEGPRGSASEEQDDLNAYGENWRDREEEEQKEVVQDSTENKGNATKDEGNVSNKGGEGFEESLAQFMENALWNTWMGEQPSEATVTVHSDTEIPREGEENSWGKEGEGYGRPQDGKVWWEEDNNKPGKEQKEDIWWEKVTASNGEIGKTEMGTTGGAEGENEVMVREEEGFRVGEEEGVTVGEEQGVTEGVVEGEWEGGAGGEDEGDVEGEWEGGAGGEDEGDVEGEWEGGAGGEDEGDVEGEWEGGTGGEDEGDVEGEWEGRAGGEDEGVGEGEWEGGAGGEDEGVVGREEEGVVGEGDGGTGEEAKEGTEGNTGQDVEVKGDGDNETEILQWNGEQDSGQWRKVEEDQENEYILEGKDNSTRFIKYASSNPGFELDPLFLFILLALGVAVFISAFVTLIWFLKSRRHVGFHRLKQTDDDMDEHMEDYPFNHQNK
uniref:high mobility group nucleosome-binding domain-containing protein 5-like isoform X2 n=1 Tax=Myxine glutinosa TaxID=7769 RepID=UPI00358EEEDB